MNVAAEEIDRLTTVRHAIGEYYAALEAGRDPRVARDCAFLDIESALGMSPPWPPGQGLQR